MTEQTLQQRLEVTASQLAHDLGELDAARSRLQGELRRIRGLLDLLGRLTPGQLASLPPDTPIEWIEAFARSQAHGVEDLGR